VATCLLLGLDIGLAWMVVQGAYVYLGLVWHGLAGETVAPGALAEHGRQFLVLRAIHLATSIAAAATFFVWRARARRVARGPAGHARAAGRVTLAAALLAIAAALAHGLAAGLADHPLRPLDLGGPMQLLVAGLLLEIAAAVVTILLVRRISAGPAEEGRPVT
jgi:hypothetical protein